jgi:hypothetical protein
VLRQRTLGAAGAARPAILGWTHESRAVGGYEPFDHWASKLPLIETKTKIIETKTKSVANPEQSRAPAQVTDFNDVVSRLTAEQQPKIDSDATRTILIA